MLSDPQFIALIRSHGQVQPPRLAIVNTDRSVCGSLGG